MCDWSLVKMSYDIVTCLEDCTRIFVGAGMDFSPSFREVIFAPVMVNRAIFQANNIPKISDAQEFRTRVIAVEGL